MRINRASPLSPFRPRPIPALALAPPWHARPLAWINVAVPF